MLKRKAGHTDVAVKVRIPTPLRAIVRGQEAVELNGANLGEAIAELEQQYPGIRDRLCNESGELRRFVNIYVNGDDVRFLSGLATPLKAGDEVSIVPAVAGGA